MNAVLTKLLILIYGLSITGYVLLEGGHEILHAFKSTLHQHEVDHHHGHAHNVNDHHTVFTSDDEQNVTTLNDSIKIFGFFLFYQVPVNYSACKTDKNSNVNGLFKKLLTLAHAPLTRPPLI